MTTTSDDLFLAILAMGSYNRGYGPGIAGFGGENDQIGEATIGKNSGQLLEASADVTAGLHAFAYNWNGQTVISYQGFVLPAKRSAEPGSIGRWCRPEADELEPPMTVPLTNGSRISAALRAG